MSGERILLLGLDGLDWALLRPLMDRGELPHFQQLTARGVHGNLHTLSPTLSPILWNSIATGKRASQHGIHGFIEVDEDTGRVRPASSLSRRCKAIWNILEQENRTCQVVNWFASHPAEPLRGVMVSDRFAETAPPSGANWPCTPGSLHPPALAEGLAELRVRIDEIDESLMRLFVADGAKVDQRSDRSLAIIAEELAKAFSVHAAATRLLETSPWDFAAVYWRTPDLLFHHFMPYHPPAVAGSDPARAALYGDVVNSVCRMFDLMLGTYLQLAGPEANIVIVSDHGFQSGRQRPPFAQDPFADPEAWHRQQGVLLMAGPAFKSGETVVGAGLLDLVPTLLSVAGLPVGRDMDGRILAEALREPPSFATIESWENVPGADGRHRPGTKLPPDDDDRLVRQFVELGYIEPLSADRVEAAAQCREQNEWNLARDYLDQGRPFKALELFESLLARHPGSLPLSRDVAECLRHIGLVDEARRVVAAATAEQTPGPGLRFLEAELAAESGAWAEALQRLQTLEAAQGPSVPVLLRLGDAYQKLARLADARAAYARALQIDRDSAWAVQGLAQIFLRERFWQLAATHAFRAISLHHNLPQSHYVLGLALERLGHHREAVGALRSAIIYSPWNLGLRRMLVQLLAKQRAPAEEQQAEALALERARELRAGAERRVEELRLATAARRRDAGAASVTPAPRAESGAGGALAPITVVTGMPRSGTSLMMKMLQAGGLRAKVDDERPADDDNPEGYYEWQAVKRLPAEPALIEAAAGCGVKIVTMLVGHLPRGARYDYRFIFMRRPVEEVLASQQVMIRRRHGEAPAEDAAMASRLAAHAAATLERLEENFPGRVLVVDYPELVRDPVAWTARLGAFLGAERLPHLDRVPAVVKPQLHRQRQSRPSADESRLVAAESAR